jgi:hypothetical protein
MALLKLSDKYSSQRLEAACKRALTYTSSPNFKTVQTILATGQDELPQEKIKDMSADFGVTRDSEYYGNHLSLDFSQHDQTSGNGGEM